MHRLRCYAAPSRPAFSGTKARRKTSSGFKSLYATALGPASQKTMEWSLPDAMETLGSSSSTQALEEELEFTAPGALLHLTRSPINNQEEVYSLLTGARKNHGKCGLTKSFYP
ncbi:hypothetical protein AAFF_G00377790 [Aldrovandia affinis]|uniref:Uncharacterized protein n=1 Tax=Aldrovandia affinis TaxID=143900 RepID=A0AAD7SG89_9TELE|nr:hypothetical protein AAFF_G00377790 [Aldrovandia affinis]